MHTLLKFHSLGAISALVLLGPNCIASEDVPAGDTVKVIWRRITLYPDASGVPGLPAVGDDGSVYFGSTDSILYALSRDGSDKWKYDTKGTITGDVTIDDKGTIYVASGGLLAFGPEGKLKWKIPSERLGASSPAVGPTGQIYFLRDEKLCAATNEGKIQWERETHGDLSFSPVVGKDGTVYSSGYKQGSTISRLHAFKSNGTPKWTFETQGAIRASPALDEDDTIYFGGYLGNLYAVAADGRLKWVFETERTVWATPAVSKDHVIYFGSGNSLYAVTNEGKLKWTVQTGGPVGSSPAIDVEGNIWFASNDGKLYCVKPDGSVNQTVPLEGLAVGNVLIAKDKTLYLRDMRSLRALQGALGPADGVWPTKRHDQHGTGRLDGTQEQFGQHGSY